jgi:DNA topoisomerase-1
VRERLEHIGIPPAWTDVWIAPYDNGHIQATGLDAVGRRQYIYHPSWREKKDRLKFDRALQLAETLPTARRRVTLDLRSEGLTRERVLAAALRMLDSGSLRVGSERYTNENGSHGLATLLCAHVRVRKDELRLSFPAKSGKTWESRIDDADLAVVVRQLKRRGGNARLLAYKEGRRWHPVSSPDINEYVKERTGEDFTAKDFRTLRGTVAAAVSLANSGPQSKGADRKRAVSRAMVDASAVLGNTPTIARKSYVDPRLLDHFDAGETIDPKRLDSAESEIRALLYQEGDVVELR